MTSKAGRPSSYTDEIAERVEIYALSDPRSGEIRYIGKANNAQKRLKSHLRDARHRDTPVYRWIRKLAREGFSPSVIVLASVQDDWQRVEVGFIAEGRSMGLRLLNVADGGNEPYCPPEVRAENARRAAKSRPAGIAKAMRWMELHLRMAPKHEKILQKTGIVEKRRSQLSAFNEKVKWHRRNGTIDALNAALIDYFNRIENRRAA
jgi:hypothetical protein